MRIAWVIFSLSPMFRPVVRMQLVVGLIRAEPALWRHSPGAAGRCSGRLVNPAALTKAVSVNPRVIGSAAGLYGFGQMFVGAVCTTLSGVGPDPMLSSALIMLTAAL